MKKEHFTLLKHTEHAWVEVISKITYKEYRADGLDLRDEKKIVRKSSAKKLEEEEKRADEDIWEVMTSPKLQKFNRPHFDSLKPKNLKRLAIETKRKQMSSQQRKSPTRAIPASIAPEPVQT